MSFQFFHILKTRYIQLGGLRQCKSSCWGKRPYGPSEEIRVER